jgi:hypothetical protein
MRDQTTLTSQRCREKARALRELAGVAVTATRCNRTIHDFVLLNGIKDVPSTQAALKQASEGIRDALKP